VSPRAALSHARRANRKRRPTGGNMKMCQWCNGPIPAPRSRTRATSCSPTCADELRLMRLRNWQAARYVPKPAPVARKCEVCDSEYVPYVATAAVQKSCSRKCRYVLDARRKSDMRPDARPCATCGVAVSRGKPGKPICDACKIDVRDPVKGRAKERRRTFRAYGITEQAYNDMVARQGNRCAICGTDDPTGGASLKTRLSWSIDHDHRCCPYTGGSCGKCVRGLLCAPCNLGIGQLGDDPARVSAALAYLVRYQAVSA